MVSAENTDLFLNDESMKEDFFEEYPSSLNIEIEEFYTTSETLKKNDEDFYISSSENDEIYKGKKTIAMNRLKRIILIIIIIIILIIMILIILIILILITLQKKKKMIIY